MSYPGRDVQAGIVRALQIEGAPVYDRVPADPSRAHIQIVSVELDRMDSADKNGWRCAVRLAVKGDPLQGKADVHRLNGAIFSALHKQPDALGMTRFTAMDMLVESADVSDFVRGGNTRPEGRVAVTIEIWGAPAGADMMEEKENG